MRRVVLASESPRRRELMVISDIPFMCASALIEEKLDDQCDLGIAVERLALQKAMAVANKYPDEFIIGADTIVVCDGEVFGKPKDNADAKRMLTRLSGKTHQVITGVALYSKNVEECFHEVTDVTFFPLSDEEIERYIKTKEPHDKAGAYAIQGKGLMFVEKINGDYYNVVGLPLARLMKHLNKYIG